MAVQPYFLIRHELSVHEGIVFREERVVVPIALTSRLVNFANENHQVIVVYTKLRLRDLYWWQVTKAVKQPLTCHMADMCAVTRVAPMHPITHADRYTISLTDYRSKWPKLHLLQVLLKICCQAGHVKRTNRGHSVPIL